MSEWDEIEEHTVPCQKCADGTYNVQIQIHYGSCKGDPSNWTEPVFKVEATTCNLCHSVAPANVDEYCGTRTRVDSDEDYSDTYYEPDFPDDFDY